MFSSIWGQKIKILKQTVLWSVKRVATKDSKQFEKEVHINPAKQDAKQKDCVTPKD